MRSGLRFIMDLLRWLVFSVGYVGDTNMGDEVWVGYGTGYALNYVFNESEPQHHNQLKKQ